MNRNVEIKIPLTEAITPDLIYFLYDNTNDIGILEQVDTYIKCTNGRLKFREINGGDDMELIQYYRPDNDVRLSSYRVLQADFLLKKVLMESVGTLVVVKKIRHVLIVNGRTRIHLDTVENLGHFLELEVVLRSDETEEDGQKEVNEIINNLGLSNIQPIKTSYSDMLLDILDGSK